MSRRLPQPVTKEELNLILEEVKKDNENYRKWK
jgi:hypothetical protein